MLTHNAHEVSVQLEAHGAAMERDIWAELAKTAQTVDRKMRDLAPKWRSVLVNSIAVNMPAPLTWEIRPGVDYAINREKGRRPGKGLPPFFSPEAKPLVDWLESHAFKGLSKPRKPGKRFTARELELRDRYMGLSWHAKRKGLRAQPFVEPVALVLERTFPQHMNEFVAQLVARANADGGAA